MKRDALSNSTLRATLRSVLRLAGGQAGVLNSAQALERVAGRTEKPGGVDPAQFIPVEPTSGTNARRYLELDVPLSMVAPNEAGDRYDATVGADRARSYGARSAAGAPPVLLAISPGTGLLNVIDGGHRVTAARLRGDQVLRALVSTTARDLALQQLLDRWFGDRVAENGCAVADNFCAWYAGSEVLDAQGLPRVLYHGTCAQEDFNEFQGGWFTPDADLASDYALKDGGRVMPVFVRMERPVDRMMAWDEARHAGHDEQRDPQAFDHYIRERWDGYALQLGGQQLYIPFRPEQVKSAIGNSGLFDGASPALDDATASPVETEAGPVRPRVGVL